MCSTTVRTLAATVTRAMGAGSQVNIVEGRCHGTFVFVGCAVIGASHGASDDTHNSGNIPAGSLKFHYGSDLIDDKTVGAFATVTVVRW